MNTASLPIQLILASSSHYRQLLLQRLGIPFECHSPEIDETSKSGEQLHDLVTRLSLEKARIIGNKFPSAVIIGSDQVAVFDGQALGKPGNYQAAMEQLARFSGQTVEFLTAVAIQSGRTGYLEQFTNRTRVQFRELKKQEIERYLEKEKPFDCAGAFKAEGLGISLFERIISDDPTALIGLPLIRTSSMLRKAGIQVP